MKRLRFKFSLRATIRRWPFPFCCCLRYPNIRPRFLINHVGATHSISILSPLPPAGYHHHKPSPGNSGRILLAYLSPRRTNLLLKHEPRMIHLLRPSVVLLTGRANWWPQPTSFLCDQGHSLCPSEMNAKDRLFQYVNSLLQ